MKKSTMFYGSMKEGVKREILKVMPFKEGKLPVRYLGVPLVTRKLSVKDCKCLIDKVRQRIFDWRNKHLSYAGRIQLIGSVLSAMHLYWAQSLDNQLMVADLFDDTSWKWPMGWLERFPILQSTNNIVLDSNKADIIIWIDKKNREGNFSIRRVWKDFHDDQTKDRLAIWYPGKQMSCALCRKEMDSMNHVFFACEFSKKVWDAVKVNARIEVGLLLDLRSKWIGNVAKGEEPLFYVSPKKSRWEDRLKHAMKELLLTEDMTSHPIMWIARTRIDGNLVLHELGQPIWQSFDHPTDTLLPNQPFTKNTQLVSSRSPSNYSSGFYRLFFDYDSILRLLYDARETTSLYWPDPRLLSYEVGRYQYNDRQIAILDSNGQFNLSDGFKIVSADYGTVRHRIMKIDTDGNLRLYSLVEHESGMKWEIQWQAVSYSCKIHGACGPNSV
ncbi:putative receptor protein kinase ZmPK1, partial [Tanacetum coccineum]